MNEAAQASNIFLKDKIFEIPCVQTKIEEKVIDVPQIQEVERYVPVPLVQTQEVIRHVPKISVREKVVRVPQIQTRIQEKIVEIPQIQEVERRVVVPQVQVQEVIKEVPKITRQEKIVPVPQVQTRISEKIVEVPTIEQVEKYIPVPQVQVQEVVRRVPRKICTERVVPVPEVQQIRTRTGPALFFEDQVGFCTGAALAGGGYRLGPPVMAIDGYVGDYCAGLSPGVMSPVLSPCPSFLPAHVTYGVGDYSGSFGRGALVGSGSYSMFPPISPVGSVSIGEPPMHGSVESGMGGLSIATPVTAVDIPIGQYSFQPSGQYVSVGGEMLGVSASSA